MYSTRRTILSSGLAVAFVAAALTAPAAAQASSLRAKSPCTIVGTSGPDRLIGTAGIDVICGLGGDDTIWGRGGDDIIYGGAGDDSIDGNRGRDRLIGGAGEDAIDGGPGVDDISGDGGQDRLGGGPGDDFVTGGPGEDEEFQGRPPSSPDGWTVSLEISFDRPLGTEVEWIYDPPSGNCLISWKEWTDPVPPAGNRISHELFVVKQRGSCWNERSWGTWKVITKTPVGSRSTDMTVETGLPNAANHYAEARCQSSHDMGCTGGSASDAAGGEGVVVKVTIGPGR